MSDLPWTIVKRDDLRPICPHCESDLPEVYSRVQGTAFVTGRSLVFFCPHCRKVLGFGQERMI